jgi:putative membrane protein
MANEKSINQFIIKEDIILRDFLALERTKLANERTFFAYIRTSIYLLLAGIAFIQLKELDNIRWMSYVWFGSGLVFLVFGIYRYRQRNNRINKYYTKSTRE